MSFLRTLIDHVVNDVVIITAAYPVIDNAVTEIRDTVDDLIGEYIGDHIDDAVDSLNDGLTVD